MTTIWLLIIVFINGAGDIESARHAETYASKAHCERVKGMMIKSRPPRGVKIRCVPTDKTGRMVL